jgi:hypothetical protein
MNVLLRRASGVMAATLLAACAKSSDSASADSVRLDSARVAVSAAAATDTMHPVVTAGVSTAPPAGATRSERTEGGSIPSAVDAASAGGARVAGGPQRTPVLPRSSGCGGTFVNVIVKASALGNTSNVEGTTLALRTISTTVLAPVRNEVGSVSISPAIRAFRVTVKDPSATRRIAAQLSASPQVENAEADVCEVRIRR